MYHYAANNPVKYTDPDGRENKKALEFMINHIIGIKSGNGYSPSTQNGTWRKFEEGAENLPEQLLCYEAVWASYRNTGTTKDMPASRALAYKWFSDGGTTSVNKNEVSKKLEIDIYKGQPGDIVFMGEFSDMNGHAALLVSIEVVDDRKIVLNTVGAYSSNANYEKADFEEMVFEKNEKGDWINTSHGYKDYKFRGYGQYEMQD